MDGHKDRQELEAHTIFTVEFGFCYSSSSS